MEITNKRTPSRCREWERQRRNKFNDAITKLGEVVKSINKSKDSGKDIDNVQYPKIEIIQKATLCLNDCVLQQAQLKAEILALQVKLDDAKEKKTYKDASSQIYIEVTKQDVSTQVFIKMRKKNKNGKCVKLMMLQKDKNQTSANKPITSVDILNSSVPITKTDIKQPKLLPKTKLTDKKGPESTIVVLPASPYIFPPRPLLFPSLPPAIVLVNTNLQPTNNPSVPIVNRNNGDVTKTTMVNIMPISAYSHPLSAAKNKKTRIKLKNDISKKTVKKVKSVEKKVNEQLAKDVMIDFKTKNDLSDNKLLNNQQKEKQLKDQQTNQESEIFSNTVSNLIPTKNLNECNDKEITPVKKIDSVNDAVNMKLDDAKVMANLKTKDTATDKKTTVTTTTSVLEKSNDTVSNKENEKNTKIFSDKGNMSHEKGKENKLPNILETSLCDAVVEGGNARLELAEEFLAASPTAAFLMSFPLVSGNRAESPAEEPQSSVSGTSRDNITQRRNEQTSQSTSYFDKSNNEVKSKNSAKLSTSDISNKQSDRQKCMEEIAKDTQPKNSSASVAPNVSGDNPFLNLPIISTNYTLDTTYGLELDCNLNKNTSNQAMTNVSSNSLFYKENPFGTVKNNIYSTSGITSTHEFNSLGLYPCAMEKYSSKSKSDYSSVEDNLMKMGPSRLTYDIDLGWSHKSFDFVNCTTTTGTFCKDILTTVSAPYSTAYNPFNPELHVPLVSNSNKRDNSTKTATFVEPISNFYSQPSNLWTDDVPFYTSNSLAKNLSSKPQQYLNIDQNTQNNGHIKHDTKSFNNKQSAETVLNTGSKPININSEVQISEKFPKKSNKMHINWMTSEIRSMQSMNMPAHSDNKEVHKSTYTQLDYKSYSHIDSVNKKHDQTDNNYFPINIHNYPTQPTQEDFQIWPSTRPLGTTEVTIEPPPINLPTLVGDLALGPHDKKKNADVANRLLPQTDVQNCGNFLSVTQLMNRSTDSMHTRYQAPNIETAKIIPAKENSSSFIPDSNHKLVSSRVGNNLTQPSYIFNDPKLVNNYDNNFTQFAQPKMKSINKSDKSSKTHKNNYSAEALIRGANCSQKMHESSSSKFIMGSQKYNEYTTAQDSVAQVSHFPAILDYSDNTYAGQQFSGTTLYNTTTNTISNSFYTNFMPANSNLMASNYASATFASDFIDYTQTAECNYSNHKYEELRMRSNPTVFHQEKMLPNYKSSRKESGTKHKLESSKKEPNKKYQSKKAKLNAEVEEWTDSSHLLWQNKSSNKKHPHVTSEELPFTNYVNNQMPTQYQPELFNSHLMPSNMQSVSHNVDRSLGTFTGTSRANFNLSSIFPEITMKVQ